MKQVKFKNVPMVRLDERIEECDWRNSEEKFSYDELAGINISMPFFSAD